MGNGQEAIFILPSDVLTVTRLYNPEMADLIEQQRTNDCLSKQLTSVAGRLLLEKGIMIIPETSGTTSNGTETCEPFFD